VTEGLTLLKEEEAAGTLIKHVKLSSPDDRARIEANARVRTRRWGYSGCSYFLTEKRRRSAMQRTLDIGWWRSAVSGACCATMKRRSAGS
jgi:hypothetical protein